LQRSSRDSETNSASETAQEVSVRDNNSPLCFGAVCLERDQGWLKDEANSDALDKQDDDNGGDGGVEIEDTREGDTECPEKEASPDYFAVSLSSGDVLPREDGCSHLSAGDW